MSINDLFGSVKRKVGAGVFGLGLVLGSYGGMGCGDDVIACKDFCDYVILDCQASHPDDEAYRGCINSNCLDASQDCMSCVLSLSCYDVKNTVENNKFSAYCPSCNF